MFVNIKFLLQTQLIKFIVKSNNKFIKHLIVMYRYYIKIILDTYLYNLINITTKITLGLLKCPPVQEYPIT